MRFSRSSRSLLSIVFRAILASCEEFKPVPRLASYPHIPECGLGVSSPKPVREEKR
jgi:hypothetical protein